MSVKCSSCGTVQPSGKFCPNCGGQMVPQDASQPPQQQAAAQMPQYPPQPQSMPQPPRASGGGKGWVLWAGIGAGVLVVGAVLAFVLLRDDPTPPPVADTPKVTENNPKPNPAPAAGKTVGGSTLKLISQGSFGGIPTTMVTYGSYLGYGTANSAGFYKFDRNGKATLLARMDVKPEIGKLLGVTVGQPYNDGKTYMFANFETKLFVLAEQGGVLDQFDTDGVENALIGDYDGDGKNETIYLGLDGKGTYGFDVWRYPADNWIYKKEGRKDPWPELFQTEIKAGNNNLMMGYSLQGSDLSLLLYKWDGIGGPAVIGSFPVENKADAPVEWIASGPTGLGPTLAVVRSGAAPSVELLSVASDAKSAKSLGRFVPDGKGQPRVIPAKLTGQNSNILSVDEAGNFFLYDIGK